MKAVLDTNVLVSGLLAPFGAPGEIVRLVASGAIRLCFDARILAEYRAVLARPKFGFAPDAVAALLSLIQAEGELASPEPLSDRLPDPDDEPFLEVALAAGAEFLITGNARHYPARCRQGVRLVSPRAFIDAYRGQ